MAIYIIFFCPPDQQQQTDAWKERIELIEPRQTRAFRYFEGKKNLPSFGNTVIFLMMPANLNEFIEWTKSIPPNNMAIVRLCVGTDVVPDVELEKAIKNRGRITRICLDEVDSSLRGFFHGQI